MYTVVPLMSNEALFFKSNKMDNFFDNNWIYLFQM